MSDMWRSAAIDVTEIRMDVRCGVCDHIEFLHADVNERLCLYFDCSCTGYADAESPRERNAV